MANSRTRRRRNGAHAPAQHPNTIPLNAHQRWLVRPGPGGQLIWQPMRPDECLMTWSDLPRVIEDPAALLSPQLLRQIADACTTALSRMAGKTYPF